MGTSYPSSSFLHVQSLHSRYRVVAYDNFVKLSLSDHIYGGSHLTFSSIDVVARLRVNAKQLSGSRVVFMCCRPAGFRLSAASTSTRSIWRFTIVASCIRSFPRCGLGRMEEWLHHAAVVVPIRKPGVDGYWRYFPRLMSGCCSSCSG